MGGELIVESRSGAGSTFSFTVPLKPASCDEPGCVACEDQAPSFAGKGLTVLVAEDTPDSLKLLTLMLRELGLAVVSAQDGAEAFTRYRERPCDLLILDGQMPGLTGREATLKVREYEHQNGLPSAPIIILSANIDEQERVAYLEAGASLSLVKPVSMTALSRHLARLLPGGEETIAEVPQKGSAPVDYLGRASAKIGLPVSAIEDIFADFVRDLPDYLEAIALALEPVNRSDLSRAAHRLRGAAATLVLDELKSLAGNLEKQAESDERAALAVVYAEIRAQAGKIMEWYLARSKRGAVRED